MRYQLFSICILFVLGSILGSVLGATTTPNVSAIETQNYNHYDDVMNNRELDNNYNNSLWSLGNGIQEVGHSIQYLNQKEGSS